MNTLSPISSPSNGSPEPSPRATHLLAFESSCDETACAIYDLSSSTLLSNVVLSQIDIFKAYGGVIPEVAARSHLEAVLPVLDQAFKNAHLLTKSHQNDWSSISALAVTHTPGLLGSLLVGTLTARTLAILHQKPLYPVHHLKSHIFSAWIDQPAPPSFPLLALVVSGGHTQIIKMASETSFEIIGTTLDDAVGECFDKIAKILGLPYPGGPSISSAALGHLPDPAHPDQTLTVRPGSRTKYSFPHPKVKGLNFSFSGLKTAVLRSVQKTVGVNLNYPSKNLRTLLTPEQISDYSASFEQTAVDILLEKLSLALAQNPDTNSIVIAGGVSANSLLRAQALSRFKHQSITLFFPKKEFSGDNAAMVALAAATEIRAGLPPTNPFSLKILPRSEIS